MKRCLAVLLLMLLLFTGCSTSGVPPVSSSSSVPPPSSSAPLNEIYCDLFSDVVCAYAPKDVSPTEAARLRQELERILSGKPYSTPAKKLVRETFDRLLEGYPLFQELFDFAKPYSIREYMQIYLFTPLESMVDNLYYCCDGSPADMAWVRQRYGDDVTFAGITNTAEKWIVVESYTHIYPNGYNVAKFDAETLLNELFHAGAGRENGPSAARMHRILSEGGAAIARLPLMQTQSFSDIRKDALALADPADTDWCIELYGNYSSTYGLFSSVYFKLLALTDFETMRLYFQPQGELLIRDNLVSRYGEDGDRVFDALHYEDVTFDGVVETEQLFLQLFLRRLDEVSSEHDMAAYLQLYRLYRKVYCARYMYESPHTDATGQNTSVRYEGVHPKLNYPESDARVAEAIRKWQILNPEIPAEMTGAVADLLATTFLFSNTLPNDPYGMIWKREPVHLQRGEIRVHLNHGRLARISIGNGRYEWSDEHQRLIPEGY